MRNDFAQLQAAPTKLGIPSNLLVDALLDGTDPSLLMSSQPGTLTWLYGNAVGYTMPWGQIIEFHLNFPANSETPEEVRARWYIVPSEFWAVIHPYRAGRGITAGNAAIMLRPVVARFLEGRVPSSARLITGPTAAYVPPQLLFAFEAESPSDETEVRHWLLGPFAREMAPELLSSLAFSMRVGAKVADHAGVAVVR